MFQFDQVPTVSGHVFRREGARGAVWYAKYRLPDGRQVQKKVGPAWTGKGRPADGHFTKRSAEAWLREVLREAEAGTLPGAVRTGATFADAAAEWLRYAEEDRACKPSTMQDYRNTVAHQFNPVFGDRRIEDITARDIERWRSTLTRRGRGTSCSRSSTASSSARARSTGCLGTRRQTSRSSASPGTLTSRSTRPRRSLPWSARPRTRSTRRSSSPPY